MLYLRWGSLYLHKVGLRLHIHLPPRPHLSAMLLGLFKNFDVCVSFKNIRHGWGNIFGESEQLSLSKSNRYVVVVGLSDQLIILGFHVYSWHFICIRSVSRELHLEGSRVIYHFACILVLITLGFRSHSICKKTITSWWIAVVCHFACKICVP